MKNRIAFLLALVLLMLCVPAASASDAVGAQALQAVLSTDYTEGGGDGLGTPFMSGETAAEVDCAMIYTDLYEGGDVAIITPTYTVLWKNVEVSKQLLTIAKVCVAWETLAGQFDSELKLSITTGKDEGVKVESVEDAAALLRALTGDTNT